MALRRIPSLKDKLYGYTGEKPKPANREQPAAKKVEELVAKKKK